MAQPALACAARGSTRRRSPAWTTAYAARGARIVFTSVSIPFVFRPPPRRPPAGAQQQIIAVVGRDHQHHLHRLGMPSPWPPRRRCPVRGAGAAPGAARPGGAWSPPQRAYARPRDGQRLHVLVVIQSAPKDPSATSSSGSTISTLIGAERGAPPTFTPESGSSAGRRSNDCTLSTPVNRQVCIGTARYATRTGRDRPRMTSRRETHPWSTHYRGSDATRLAVRPGFEAVPPTRVQLTAVPCDDRNKQLIRPRSYLV